MIIVVVISGILQSIIPLSIKVLTDNFIVSRNIDGFFLAGLIFFILVCIATATIYGFYVLGGKLEYGVSKEIRKVVFKKVKFFSLSTMNKYGTNELISRLTSDIQKLSEVLSWGIVDALHSLIRDRRAGWPHRAARCASPGTHRWISNHPRQHRFGRVYAAAAAV